MTSRLAARAITRHPVLRDLDLDVERGEIVALAGTRVACTATLRCLTGTYRPAIGGRVDVEVADDTVDLVAASARELAWLRMHLFAILDGPIAAPPRVGATAATARSAGLDHLSAFDALGRLGAGHLGSVPIGRLQTHEAATVALAAALAKRAPIVVLDLDEGGDERAHEWIAERAAGGAAVLLTGPAPRGITTRTLTITQEQR